MLHKLARGIFDEAPLESGPDELEQVFAANGTLAQHSANYTVRGSQLQLARAVYRALSEGRHLMVEAPCGTGKSIGYAVPAILTRDKRKIVTVDPNTGTPRIQYAPVIIVTANIALQEQLVKKDLPFLQKALPTPFTFGLLKGRQNYLCRTMYEYGSVSNERDTVAERDAARKVAEWAETTTTGDKSELDFEPPPNVWRRFSMSNDECPGRLCALFDQCHGYTAQRAAQTADVIVTNYHTLFADIHLRSTVGAGILPEHSPVILDEAHEAADIARDVMGGTLSLGMMLAAFSACSKAGLCGRGAHDNAVYNFFGTLDTLIQSGGGDGRTMRLRQKNDTDAGGLANTLAVYADRALQAVEIQGNALTANERTVLLAANKRALNAARLLQILDELPDMYVVALEKSQGNSPTVSVKVIEPGQVLQQTLYKRPSVICTSATLTAQSTFELVRSELGAPRDHTDYADLPSPFDFQQQSLLIVPAGIPDDPNSEEFRNAMAEALCETVKYARGRTLGLFTSYRNLRLAGDALRASGCPYRVLQQGDAPRTLLTTEFRNDVNSVLLGTTSFWTGVDVPGEALSCVFIDKLPFPEMSNPVIGALSERYPDEWFQRFSLPRAIMTLRQGVGRLIRDANDRGVVVILDQRLRTKNYGHGVVRSLPQMPTSSNLADVKRFLDEPARN
jgi:ATP-dependent DNA helicase DinG